MKDPLQAVFSTKNEIPCLILWDASSYYSMAVRIYGFSVILFLSSLLFLNPFYFCQLAGFRFFYYLSVIFMQNVCKSCGPKAKHLSYIYMPKAIEIGSCWNGIAWTLFYIKCCTSISNQLINWYDNKKYHQIWCNI